jgi:hypothetical protein
MNALRQIIDQKTNDLHIRIPDEFKGHRLEVLVVSLDSEGVAPNSLTRPKVGTITSPPIACSKDAFAPLTEDELRDWGI